CTWRGAQGCWRNALSKLQKAGWFWPLRDAQPWMAQCAVLHAGVAWPLSFAQRAGGAGAARERDAYL
ncbi:hypothetical protein A2U01_0098588, partial [Trifolium medium]|nr:hypothetical protein [Trifolium medium]